MPTSAQPTKPTTIARTCRVVMSERGREAMGASVARLRKIAAWLRASGAPAMSEAVLDAATDLSLLCDGPSTDVMFGAQGEDVGALVDAVETIKP